MFLQTNNKQTNKHANMQTYIQRYRLTNRQTASQPASQPGRQAGRQADVHACSHTNAHAHMPADKLTAPLTKALKSHKQALLVNRTAAEEFSELAPFLAFRLIEPTARHMAFKAMTSRRRCDPRASQVRNHCITWFNPCAGLRKPTVWLQMRSSAGVVSFMHLCIARLAYCRNS